MDYRVLVVEDHQLPDGNDWVIARRGGEVFLMIKRCRFSVEGGLCDVLVDAWGAWMARPSRELVAV